MQRRPSWSELPPALVSLVLLGLLPFLSRRPLVRDETTSIHVAAREWGAFWRVLDNVDAPLGLYYLLLRPVVALSDGAFAARLPSLVGAVVAVAVVVRTVEIRWGRPAALGSGLVLLANPVVWQIAGLARPYSLALATASVTFYVLLARPERSVLYGVMALLTAYLQLLFALFLVAQAVMLVAQRRRRLLGALVVAGAATVPLAVVASGQTVMTSWIPYTAGSSLVTEADRLFGTTGALTLALQVVCLLLALLAARHRDLRPLLLMGAVPALVLVVIGTRVHVLGARYFFYVLLVLAVSIGVALSRVASQDARRVAVAGLALLGVLSAVTEMRVDYRQEDLRTAALYLHRNTAQGDALLYAPDWARPGMSYWLARTPGAAPADIAVVPGTRERSTGHLFLPELTTTQLVAALSEYDRVWIVGYPGQTWRPTVNTSGDVADGLVEAWSTRERVSFGEIELRLLER